MEVIKKGKAYQVVCPICNSLLEPAEKDLLGGFGDWPYMIKCPVCDNRIDLDSKKVSYIRERTKKGRKNYE